MTRHLLNNTVVDPEAARVAAIDDFASTKCLPGHEALIAKMRADGRSSAGDVAMAVLAIERPNMTAKAASASATIDRYPDLEAVERSAISEWAAKPAIRAEFGGNQASYVAFRKAEAQGKVRPLRRP